MSEDDLRFWIVPIICIVAVLGIFSLIVANHFFVVIPNSVIQMDDLQKMSCGEITAKHAQTRYWSKENAEYGKNKAEGCAAADAAIKAAEKEKLEKLLADPNSFESLTRDLEKFQDLYDAHKELYEFHSAESKILQQNVTDFENQVKEIKSKLSREYGVN